MDAVLVTGVFDDFRSVHMRFLHEASTFGEVHVFLPDDHLAASQSGKSPHFPLAERLYLLQSIRFVAAVHVIAQPISEQTFTGGLRPARWIIAEDEITPQQRVFAQEHGIEITAIPSARLAGFPILLPNGQRDIGRKKVVVTGCFDWFHSGHVRFFEEAAAFGDLYVIVGHDENLRLLKGEGHPLFPQEDRRYMVQGIRFVYQALISSGHGWMDAEPEIEALRPDIYIVNEDGHVPEKRLFCDEHGMEYVILKRTPKEGLPSRQSTDLRGY